MENINTGQQGEYLCRPSTATVFLTSLLHLLARFFAVPLFLHLSSVNGRSAARTSGKDSCRDPFPCLFPDLSVCFVSSRWWLGLVPSFRTHIVQHDAINAQVKSTCMTAHHRRPRHYNNESKTINTLLTISRHMILLLSLTLFCVHAYGGCCQTSLQQYRRTSVSKKRNFLTYLCLHLCLL
jgi:hypothetical protein